MRLHKSQISKLVDSIIETLTETNEFVEVAERPEDERIDPRRGTPLPETKIDELRRDVQSVLYSYLNNDQRLHREARARVERQGEDQSEVYNTKRQLAKQEGFGLGEEAPSYIIEQLIETMLHSSSVEEIFAEDKELRVALLPILRESMNTRRNLQQEVNTRLKQIERSSQSWEDLFFAVNQRLKDRYQID
jgi:hypothetical protein